MESSEKRTFWQLQSLAVEVCCGCCGCFLVPLYRLYTQVSWWFSRCYVQLLRFVGGFVGVLF